MMEQLTNERIDQLQITLLRLAMKLGNDELEGKFAKLCAQAKAFGELAKAIHYPDCWCTTAYPTVADALAQVYATFQCTNADTHLDITRLDLIGELTSPEYISRLRGVMGEGDIAVDKGGVRFGKWYWVSHEAITGCCEELIPTKHRQYWEWALANINRSGASPVAGEVKG